MDRTKKALGIISYNIYGNFTNYGSALQSWALHQAVRTLGIEPVLVDYCPDILRDKDALNPFKNMWDKDAESRRMCELSMPAIRDNYYKFDAFYTERFNRTAKKYTSENFNDVVGDESLSGFICGSDTIFCMDEFGFDDGYFANYGCMKGRSVAYAPSFGDPTLTDENCSSLNERLGNFKAIGLRENLMLQYVREHTRVPVQRVIDPTLLFDSSKYEELRQCESAVEGPYILYYSRRYSPAMEEYAEKLAEERSCSLVDISLRATNAEKGHIMKYSAGVEEFLTLVKNAEFVVTNSFHGMIFAVQYRRPFVIFSREQCNNKIEELLTLFGLKDRMLVTGKEEFRQDIDYDLVHDNITKAREASLKFLKAETELLFEKI